MPNTVQMIRFTTGRFTMRKFIALFAALFALTFAAACGDNGMEGMDHGSSKSDSSTREAADRNAADVKFAQDMIPHHGQAIVMAKLATTRASSPQVKTLAQKIEAAQDLEIKIMSEWLKAWGEEVPSADMGNMAGHGSMPGMMSTDEMAKLERASGAELDRMFVDMMIRHHQGAIDMARTEQKDGKNAKAKALATQIEAAQTAEIGEMQTLANG
jgi:uncharacterized protein (DUF305 family)